MSDYTSNHIATAAYLGHWTDQGSGRLARVLLGGPGESEHKKPRKVGRRLRFFGLDPAVRRQAELRFGRYEAEGIEALRSLAGTWPPSRDMRLKVGCFVGIHMVRNPAFVSGSAEISEETFMRNLPLYRETMTEGQIEEMHSRFKGSEFQIEYMLDSVLKQAGLLASMHWSILTFPDRLLATADQPVTVVPLLAEGEVAPIEAMPRSGFLACEEIRFPIDPEHALLMTWAEGFDSERPHRAGDDVAAELNRAVIAQADREWFHHPARRATRLKAGQAGFAECGAVGRLLDPRYGTVYALKSHRRAEAARLMEMVIENDVPGEIAWTEVTLGPGIESATD